jgi:hypothetical protein
MNIFEQAARVKLRFESPVGFLTTEQLFDLPLTSKAGRQNLDDIAREVYKELKGLEEVSFVALKPDPRKTELELQLELLKHVIAVKLEAKAAAEKAAADAERKRRLLGALARKEEGELEGMTREQLEAEIAKIGA